MMQQRWMKTLAVFTISALLFSSCKEKTYSPDEPLPDTYTPSVFISSQNKIIYALNPTTGQRKWEYNTQANVKATPCVVGDFLYVPTTSTLLKLEVKTGKLLKTISLGSPDGYTSSPVTDGKLLYIAGMDGNVRAIEPSNNDAVKWLFSSGDAVLSSLVIYGGSLYVVNKTGKMNALDILNGSSQWTTNVPITAGTELFSSPVVSDPYIYIGSTDFNLYAYTITAGAPAWNFLTEGIINSSPIVYGGNIIFGSADNYVYCIDSTAKNVRWKFKTSDRVASSATAYAQVVYVGGYDAYMYAINIIDGTLRWKYQTGALVHSSPIAYQGGVYIGGFDKQFYKFDTSGTLKWKYNINGPIETSPIYYDLTRTYYPSITGMSPY